MLSFRTLGLQAQEHVRFELPRQNATLSEAVVYGEIGFAPVLPTTGLAAQENAALLAELRVLEWLPPAPRASNIWGRLTWRCLTCPAR